MSSADPQIVSASRRTDIPAFYMPWFMERIRAGYARCPHPFTGQILETSLHPAHVHSIVFWTKDARPLLEHLDELEERGYACTCHFTINAMPRSLEPAVPPWEKTVQAFAALSARWGPERVWWRFDPILFTAEEGPDRYRQRFRELSAALEGLTRRCFFSFAAFYGKVTRRLASAGVSAVDPSPEEKQDFARELGQMAAQRGMSLLSCCNDDLLGEHVGKAHCIDAALLRALFPDRPLHAPARPTRKQCGCSASRDIGMYDTCPHRCIYCYANQDPARVAARHRRHVPHADMLVPPAGSPGLPSPA